MKVLSALMYVEVKLSDSVLLWCLTCRHFENNNGYEIKITSLDYAWHKAKLSYIVHSLSCELLGTGTKEYA